MKVRQPGRNPGTASLCDPLLCSVYLLFHVGNPGRNPGTAWYLFFMFSICQESSEIGSQVKVMYVMWNNLVTRLTNAEKVVNSKEHQMWGTRKRSRGLGAGTYSAYLFFTNPVVCMLGIRLTRTRIFISNVCRAWNFVTRLSNAEMVDKSRNCLSTVNMEMNSETCCRINQHSLFFIA